MGGGSKDTPARFRVSFGAYNRTQPYEYPIYQSVDAHDQLADSYEEALDVGRMGLRRVQSALPVSMKAHFTITGLYES